MFGKKEKLQGIPVMHYQGLPDFPQDHPCAVEVAGDTLIFRKIKPEVSVTLPVSKVTNIESLMEENYMLAYHNDKAKTAKFASKWYYVINYQGKDGPTHIDVWAVPGKATQEMDKVKSMLCASAPPTSYSL